MVFIFPLAIWLGIVTIISLFTTLSLGIAVFYFRKNVFKYHKNLAFFTAIVAIIHLIFAVLLWFFGVLI
jgi:hypothetical protein